MSSQRHDHEVVVYADYVCPFCYLGKATLERYLADADDPPDVDWRFYDLRGNERGPDGEVDLESHNESDESYFEQARRNVERLKAEYGVEMTVDVSLEVDSWNAQQVALYVRETGGSTDGSPAEPRAGNGATRERADEATFRALHERIFDALWREGADVGDPEVLRELVTEVDLNPAVVDEALTEEWAERLRERFAQSRSAGVTGVPTFVYGDRVTRGAVPPEQIERLVEGA